LERSPLSIKKFFSFLKKYFKELSPFFVSILKYFLSPGSNLQNLSISSLEFVKDNAKLEI